MLHLDSSLHLLLLICFIVCFRSFREAVAANKHGLPFLIVTAISMVTVVAIPWALKVFKETQAKTQLEELLKRLFSVCVL